MDQIVGHNLWFRETINGLDEKLDWRELLNLHIKLTTPLVDQVRALRTKRDAARGVATLQPSLSTNGNTVHVSSLQTESATTKRPEATSISSEAKIDTPKSMFGNAFTPKTGFQPTSSSGNSKSSFMNDFAKSAKTLEELAAERKRKAKEEDYDSDDDEEEWSRNYDEKEAARLAEEKKQTQGFSFTPELSTTNSTSGNTAASVFVAKPSAVAPSTSKSLFAPSTTSNATASIFEPKPSTSTSKSPFAPSTALSSSTTSLFAPKPSTESPAEPSKSIFSSSVPAAGAAPSFSFKTSADTPVGLSKPGFSFSNPMADTATPPISRGASPALSVFESQNAAPSPATNIFSHLSSGPSSNGQEESSDEENHDRSTPESKPADQSNGSTAFGGALSSSNWGKRKQDESDTDSETIEDVMRRKRPAAGSVTPSTPSLFSRMTNADGSKVTEADMKARLDPATPTANGVGQSTNNIFKSFDFSNPPQTAPPKTQSFAGDQTFKFGNPVVFATPGPGAKPSPPTVTVQQASPSPALDLTKGSPFGHLNPPAFGSAASSALSSRATTPLSDTTEQGSAADNDEEAGSKGPQLDLAGLTEDEQAEYDVLFHTEVAIAKQFGDQKWTTIGRGPLWILLSRETQKAIVRMRIPNGSTPLNYNIMPSIEATVASGSGKQVKTAMPVGAEVKSMVLALKSREVAEEFCAAHNQYTS